MQRVVLVAAVLAVVACNKVEDPGAASHLRAGDGLPGTIRAALGPESKVAAGEFDLYVSAKSGAATVGVCPAVTAPGDCKVGANGYLASVKTSSVGGVDIFRVQGTVRPSAGLTYVAVSRDANGVATEAQKIRFAAKGNGGLGTPDLSQGTGGQKGRTQGTYQSANASLRYIINAPQDNGPAKAHGLLVLLHGSSASSYDTFVDDMAQVSNQFGLIPVSVLAPNGQGWNEDGDVGQRQAADLLDGLVQTRLLKEYNIDRTKIFFSGQSSGAGWLSSHFIPLKGATYRGGAFMQCGVVVPSQFTVPEAMKRGFKLHFEITSSDPIWLDNFDPAVSAYQSLGLVVTSDRSKPGGHCQFDQAQVIAQHIGPMLQN